MDYSVDRLESADNPLVLFRGIVGSRAYGTQNANSDTDVRGIFAVPSVEYARLAQPPKQVSDEHNDKTYWYLQLKDDAPDTIVEALPDDIDVSLWDLRKALLQMTKSNASFFEWLGSPIIYKDDGTISILNALKSECFNPTHAAYHYASMFRNAMEARNADGSIRIKKLCYALRASLCLKCIMAVEEMPPTPFADVLERVSLDPGEREAIHEVLAKKESALESDVIVPDARLASLLADRYDSIAVHLWHKNGTASEAYAKLEQLFRDYVKEPVRCG